MRYVHPGDDTVLKAVKQAAGRHNIRHNAETPAENQELKNAASAVAPEELLVSAAGFEPATHALKGHCSTT